MSHLISVVVCTYNQEQTIGRALDSILMQQCHVPYEIIIGEDYSTDGTLEICKQYAAQHPDIIRVLSNKKNKGLINNYFDCILASNGQYIADCAGDDYWEDPLKLEKEVTILETNSQVTLVHTPWYYVNEKGQKTKSTGHLFTDPITNGNVMLEDIIIQTSIPIIQLCTSLYRKDIVLEEMKKDEYMFRNKEFGCEDLQICFIMALHGKIAYLPDRTLNYSVGHESISYSVDYHKQFLFTKRVTSLSYYLAQKYHIHSARTDKYFKQRIFALYMHAFRAHSTSMYLEALQCEKEWHTQRTIKTSIASLIMKNQGLWNIALQVRKLFVTVKQVLH